MLTARAVAHSNIALVKYWGKRTGVSAELNLPAVGSISLTLDALRTETTLTPAADDAFVLDGEVARAGEATKVFAQLDRVWTAAGRTEPRPTCRVVSDNHFPTAAGLASSASGFAALTMAAAGAFGWKTDRGTLSTLARMGSGSAARSIFGGFVRLDRGEAADGSDCRARRLAGPEAWPLRLVVAQTTVGRKTIGSTGGMERSRETSPYFDAWVNASPADLDEAESAVAARDYATLAAVTERSCFAMHACMIATVPPLLYWNGVTVEAIKAAWAAREDGLSAAVTIDAGPHVKVLCRAEHAEAVAERMRAVQGVCDVLVCAPGPDASVTTDVDVPRPAAVNAEATA